MYFKKINEKMAVDFTDKLLDSYRKIDDRSINTILTHRDVEACRDNVGWYQHADTSHRIYINIPNILCAESAVERGKMDNDGFYAFLTLCVGHEFRHFLQGRVIYDGEEIDGYTQKDVLNAELMLYIRFFFDAYYLINKGYVKYEVDAEKFSVIKGIEYLKSEYPNMDAEKSMLDAVNFYADIQASGGVASTLPLGCNSLDEVIKELENKINNNERVPNLDETLFVHHPRFYQNHASFGLDEDMVITTKLLRDYYNESSGSQRDLMVVKRIISLLERPEESLDEFPHLRLSYIEKRL